MSKHDQTLLNLVEEIWDRLAAANDGRVALSDVVDAVVNEMVIDLDQMKRGAARHAVGVVDKRRTKTTGREQLSFFPHDDEYIVVGDQQRVRLNNALLADAAANVALAWENADRVTDAARWKQAQFNKLAPYLAKGMVWNAAVAAYLQDHPELLAAD